MATRRQDPYLWPTWITKILAGEQNCQWAAWLKAHYSDLQKLERSGDLIAWMARHGEMVRKRAAELRAEGYTVYVEDQNKFNLKGSTGTLGGKPDIVAVRPDDAVVVDCKSGKQRDSDHFQVQIYMLVLPETHEACKGVVVRGEIEYPDGPVLIDTVPQKIAALIYKTIRSVCGSDPLPKVPSFSECRFCDIGKADCPDRMETDTKTVTSSLF